MKNIPLSLFALATSAVFAQPAPVVKPGTGYVEFRSIDRMPIPVPPSELQNAKRITPAKADDGFSTIEIAPQIVRQFFSNVDLFTSLASAPAVPTIKDERTAPRMFQVVRNVFELKLGFTPSAMHRGELIGASPQGTIVGDSWTGVERFYRMPGIGLVRLSEIDLKATGGTFYMLKEAINTQVAGQPAIAKIFMDDVGKTVEEVLWVSDTSVPTLSPSAAVND